MKNTIYYKDHELLVDYDYQPYEAPETGIDALYPGCQEDVDINSIMLGDVDITELIYDQIEKIEELILKEHA